MGPLALSGNKKLEKGRRHPFRLSMGSSVICHFFFFLSCHVFLHLHSHSFTGRTILFLCSYASIKSDKIKDSLEKPSRVKKYWRERKIVLSFLKEKSNSFLFNKHISSFLLWKLDMCFCISSSVPDSIWIHSSRYRQSTLPENRMEYSSPSINLGIS